MGMYRKAMSTHLAAGDDSHHGRCDDGKELCPSGRKPCGPEMSLGLSDHLGGLIDRSWCNRLIYKRECQEHFSPSAGGASLVRDFQPLSP
jgi:hypothetical protein